MKFHQWSDIHTEVNPAISLLFDGLGDISSDIDALLVNGDFSSIMGYHRDQWVTRQVDKLRNHFKKYKLVLFVLGNHDYYGAEYNDAISRVRSLFHDMPHVHVLNNETYDLGDYLVVGATLWTDFNKNNPIDKTTIHRGFPDYRCIGKNMADYIDPDFILDKHKESLKFIHSTTINNPDKKIIVMSHHAPSWKCINEEHHGSVLNAAYASGLEWLFGKNLVLWTYGHTHGPMDEIMGNTRVYNNCCGYYWEPSYLKFNPLKVLEV